MEKALAGVKILDMSRVQAGPSCAQLLAFLGADVIKIEDTVGGDNTRWEQAHIDGIGQRVLHHLQQQQARDHA